MTAPRTRRPATRASTRGRPVATTQRKAAATTQRKAAATTQRKARPATQRNAGPARTRAASAATSSPRTRRREPGRLRRILTGDRVYVFVFMGVVAALVAMAINPLQNYTAAADRVDALTDTRGTLREEVDRLEERRERLHDPEEIELMARAHLGLVRPGEQPFVVVTPEPQLDRVHPEGPDAADDAPQRNVPWYRRLGRWLAEVLG